MPGYNLNFKDFVLSAVAALGWHISWSQWLTPPVHSPDSSRIGVELVADWMYQTTGIQNRLTDRFLFGGFIDGDIKDGSFENLSEQSNFIGARIKNGVRVFLPQWNILGNQRWGQVIGLHNQNTLTGNITKDLFELTFYGSGEEVKSYKVKNTGLELISSNMIEWGLYDKVYGSSFTVALHQAYNRQDLFLDRKSDLFMGEEGFTFVADGSYQGTNPLETGFSALNGWGVTTDLNWVLPVQFNNEKDPVFLNLSVHNLGVYWWSNYSTEIKLDTVYEYEGYTLINDFTAPSLPQNLQDTLGWTMENGFQYSFAPFVLSFQKIVDTDKDVKWQSFYGLSMWSTDWNLPLIHVGIDYKIKPGLHTNVHLNAGGFGRLRAGWSISYLTESKVHFWLGSQDLYGLISQQGNGRAINGGIRLWM